MMSAADVLEALASLTRSGARFWVDGGWGVDALLGKRTRDHGDPGIVLNAGDPAACAAAAQPRGFRGACRDGPFNPVLADATDRRIDVPLVDTGATVRDERRTAVCGGNGLPYPVAALHGAGRVGGRPVPCSTAQYQMQSHTGYAVDAPDIRDIAALARAFGTDMPAEYRGPQADEPR